MKIAKDIYFYEGDYKIMQHKSCLLYKGIGSSNFLIIKGSSQTMIDSGFENGPHISRINKELINDNVNIFDTSSILLSHAHPDHFLGAKNLSKKKKISFLFHKDCEPYVRNDDFFFASFFNYPKAILKEIFPLNIPMSKFILGLIGYKFNYLKADTYFDSNSSLLFYPETKIINLCGHCDGHVGLYFKPAKILYCADSFFPTGSKYNSILSVNNALSSLEKGFDDIDKIKKLDVEILVPGHGKAIFGKYAVKDYLDSIVKNTSKILADIIDILKAKQTATLTYITKKLFNRVFLNNSLTLTAIICNSLIYLNKLELIKYNFHSNKIFWSINID